MKGSWRAIPILLVVSAGTPSRTAFAEEPEQPVSKDDRGERAEASFRAAVIAFGAGRYHTAIELFSEADRLAPRAELSYDIARSYENLHDDGRAIAFYREYLLRAGHPGDEADVRRHIDRLVERGSPPPAPEPTSGIISAETPNGPFVRTAPAFGAPSHEEDRKAGSSGRVLTTLGWVGLGTATVALSGALAFELLRKQAEDRAEHEREQIRFDEDVRTMERDRTAARVLLGTGAGFAFTGAILLLLGANQPDSKGRQSRVSFQLRPGVVAADAAWRF